MISWKKSGMNTRFMTKQVITESSPLRVAVIGGGAAGLMAAGTAVLCGHDVTLFEKNPKCGRKLAITGKGRCNLTNNCDTQKFIENVPTNPRFLYTALSAFSTADCMQFFENLGVPLKTERGNRVFPVSDRAYDVVDALVSYARDVKRIHETVTEVFAEDGAVTGLAVGKKRYAFDRIIVCTGGKSYPQTGSDGDGYRFAEALGLKVIEPKPSLVPMTAEGGMCTKMQGLSLKNVAASIVDTSTGKTVYTDFGEMLFTHYGVSGPIVLSGSAHIKDITPGRYRFEIDLKPALDEATLDKRLLADFEENKNKSFANAFDALLPQKMIPVFVKYCDIPADKKINSITKEERHRILYALKHFSFMLRGFRPVSEAIITSGGVDVKELDPKTMESKKIKGLFFAGEVIDVDGYTGGFNLQIAFATAYLAANHLY